MRYILIKVKHVNKKKVKKNLQLPKRLQKKKPSLVISKLKYLNLSQRLKIVKVNMHLKKKHLEKVLILKLNFLTLKSKALRILKLNNQPKWLVKVLNNIAMMNLIKFV